MLGDSVLPAFPSGLLLLLALRCGRQMVRFPQRMSAFHGRPGGSSAPSSQKLSPGYVAGEGCLLPTSIFLGQRSLLSSVYFLNHWSNFKICPDQTIVNMSQSHPFVSQDTVPNSLSEVHSLWAEQSSGPIGVVQRDQAPSLSHCLCCVSVPVQLCPFPLGAVI